MGLNISDFGPGGSVGGLNRGGFGSGRGLEGLKGKAQSPKGERKGQKKDRSDLTGLNLGTYLIRLKS